MYINKKYIIPLYGFGWELLCIYFMWKVLCLSPGKCIISMGNDLFALKAFFIVYIIFSHHCI